MKTLIIAGYINDELRYGTHLIDLADKNFIEYLLLNTSFSNHKISIICSPLVFDNENKERFGLDYPLITENMDMVEDWLKKNMGKYDVIISLSDILLYMELPEYIKMKTVISFNTVSLKEGLSYDDFVTGSEMSSASLFSLEPLSSQMIVWRYIEEPQRYICRLSDGTIQHYWGYKALCTYIERMASEERVIADTQEQYKIPANEYVLKYNEIYENFQKYNSNNLLCHLIIRYGDEFMISYLKDPSTFFVCNRNIGTNKMSNKFNYPIHPDYQKQLTFLTMFPNNEMILFFRSHSNFLQTKFVIPHYPVGYPLSQPYMFEQMCSIGLKEYVEGNGYYFIYEEGYGYYLVIKQSASTKYAFNEISHITDDMVTLSDIKYPFVLNGVTYRELNKNIVTTNKKVLYCGADDECLYHLNIKKENAYFYNVFQKFDKEMYAGTLHPNIKYDIILFCGTYNFLNLSTSEVISFFQWLYSLLTKDGIVYIVGLNGTQRNPISDAQYIINKYKTEYWQLKVHESATMFNKRICRHSDYDSGCLLPWNPLEDETILMIQNEGFSYSKHLLNNKQSIYLHKFAKK